MLASCFIALFERPFDDEHFDIWFHGPRSYNVEAVAIFMQHTCSDNNSLKYPPVKGLRYKIMLLKAKATQRNTNLSSFQ